MKGRNDNDQSLSEDDSSLRALLRRNDPAVPPGATQLASLESRIMQRLDAHPSRLPVDFLFPFLTTGRDWILRGACLVAVLSVMLGFIAGRGFYEMSSQSANANALFTPSGAASWQSFLESPVAAGDTYDAAE